VNIYQRINAVMKEVCYVKKDRQVSGAGANYKAVTHDQVVSVARESLVKHGVVVYPEQLSSSMPIMRDLEKQIKMHLYEASYNINFVNMDDPNDKIVVQISAQANDNGDKAPGKAVTYATKTAILKVLCLETGENDESRAEERERLNTIDQHAQAFLAQAINGETNLWNNLCRAYKINDLSQLPKSKESEFTKRVHEYNKRKSENANNS
jgi:hypothetical protein